MISIKLSTLKESTLKFFELIDKFPEGHLLFHNLPGLFWFEGENLHLSLRAITDRGQTCLCYLGGDIPNLEAQMREIRERYSVTGIVVIHDDSKTKTIDNTVVIEVSSGTCGQISYLQGALPGGSCQTRITIPGVLGWVHENQTDKFI
jgi:hypothetical protein